MADILDSCVTLFPYVSSWPTLTYSWEMRLLMAVQNRVPTVVLFDSPRAQELFHTSSAAAAVVAQHRTTLMPGVYEAVYRCPSSDVPLHDVDGVCQALLHVWLNQPPTVAEVVAATEGDQSLAAAPLRPARAPPSAAALEIERRLTGDNSGGNNSNFVLVTGGPGYGKSAVLHDWARNFLATNDKRRGIWCGVLACLMS